MKISSIILTIILIFVTRHQLSAQIVYNPESKFEVKALQEDLRVLKKVMEEVQVGLHRYADKFGCIGSIAQTE
jgi:hypothetical protein